jgi:Flp pilus assembly protein TadD
MDKAGNHRSMLSTARQSEWRRNRIARWSLLGVARDGASGDLPTGAGKDASDHVLTAEPEPSHGVRVCDEAATTRRGAQLEAALAMITARRKRKGRLGALLSAKGQTDAALPHFQSAVDADPGDAAAQNNLGAALVQRGDFAAAVPHLGQARTLKPEDASVRTNLGLALLRSGRRAAAAQELEAALRLEPQNQDAKAYLQEALSASDSQ